MHEIKPGQSIELLKELHILTRDGKMNQDSRRKLKQVNHLTQFIAPLLQEIQQKHADVRLVDHGAGKSYLGFILYDLFFKNYTRKQWDTDPENLSAEVASRIPVRENRDPRYFSDKYQGIPKLGYTGMMANMLDHPGITVMTNADFFELRDGIERTLTVYTGKLDEYFGRRHGELNYRSVRFEFETVDETRHQEVSVVNYPNDYDYTRITEFKHFTGEKSDRTTLCREYPSAEGDPCYIVMTKDNLEKRQRYLADIEQASGKEPSLFLGRLAEYRYYNMDQVIEAVFLKLDGPG